MRVMTVTTCLLGSWRDRNELIHVRCSGHSCHTVSVQQMLLLLVTVVTEQTLVSLTLLYVLLAHIGFSPSSGEESASATSLDSPLPSLLSHCSRPACPFSVGLLAVCFVPWSCRPHWHSLRGWSILALQTCGSHFNASFWRTNALPLGFLPAQQMHHYANTDSTKAGVLWLDIAFKEATRTSICNFHLQPGDKNKGTKLSLWTFLCGVVAGKQFSSKYVTSLTACPFTLRSWPVLQRLLSLELGTFLIIKWALFPIGSQRWVAGHQFKRRKIIDSIKLA